MKFISLFMISLFSNLIFSQINLENNSLIFPEQQIAYIGLDNHLELDGFEPDYTTYLIVGQDTIRRSSNFREFYYKPRSKTKDTLLDTLLLYSNNKIVDTFVYKLEYLGKPKVVFGEKRDSTVTKEYLLSNPGLTITYEPQILKSYFSIVEFEASIIKSNGEEINISKDWSEETENEFNKNNENLESSTFELSKFNKAQLAILETTKPGDIIWFKTVVYRSPDSVRVKRSIDLKFIITVS